MRQKEASVWDDPVCDISYLCEPRPWANKVVATIHSQNLRFAFRPEQSPPAEMTARSSNGRIRNHVYEDVTFTFLDSLNYLPSPLRKLSIYPSPNRRIDLRKEFEKSQTERMKIYSNTNAILVTQLAKYTLALREVKPYVIDAAGADAFLQPGPEANNNIQ